MESKKSKTITEEEFHRFLSWLHADSKRAGEIYNSLHRRLTMYFSGRACGAAAHDLASATLDRAAEKHATSDGLADREPARYVFQVANFILLEHRRAPAAYPLNPDFAAAAVRANDDTLRVRCCKHCLTLLGDNNQELLRDYYLGEKRGEAKRIRSDMARDTATAAGALRIKVFRLKQKLYTCVSRCIDSKGADNV